MPSFQYVGRRPEHIVGLDAGDISAEEYDQLPYDLQQAVLINKGSDGGPLYVEIREAPETVFMVGEPGPELLIPAFEPVTPAPNLPLDEPAKGDN